MSTHTIFTKALAAGFVLSLTTLASAHNFPKPPTKAEVAAEHRANCLSAMKTGATAKRTAGRAANPSVVTTGASHRVVGAHRFGGGSHVPAVACTRPMRSHVACL